MDRRDRRLDGLEGRWPGSDFLRQVGEVCRLRTDQDRSTAGAEILERSGMTGVEFPHLVVRYSHGHWTKELVVEVCDGPADAGDVTRFHDGICAHVNLAKEAELVYRGGPASPDAERTARDQRIRLRSFAEYQDVWKHRSYLTAQTQRLLADPEYPLARHVDKRWTAGASWSPPTTTRRCDCGTPPPATPYTPCKTTPARCGRWRWTRTGTGSPPPGTTASCGCRTPPPGHCSPG